MYAFCLDLHNPYMGTFEMKFDGFYFVKDMNQYSAIEVEKVKNCAMHLVTISTYYYIPNNFSEPHFGVVACEKQKW